MNSRYYKRPESVLVVVYTAGRDVLLLQRREPPDFWQSVTGSLEPGESAVDAARRELREETGLQLAVTDCHRTNRFPIHPAWRTRYAPDVSENTEHVFHATLPAPREITLNPDEHRAYRWLSVQQAAQLASSSTNRDAIRALFAGPG